MESCGMSLIKYLLFFFNTVFAISGIAIIAAGSVVIADSNQLAHLDDGNLFGPAIVLIVTGSIVFVIAFLGCFGAIRESYCMLISFAVCLLIIFIVELAVGIAVAVNKSDLTDDKLKASLDRFQNEQQDKDFWNKIQTNLQCCGISGSRDWGNSPPYSCCRATPEKETDATNPFCSTSSGNDNKYMSTVGCLDKLKMGVQNNSKALIGVGIGIAFIEIVGIILACWLAAVIKKEDTTK